MRRLWLCALPLFVLCVGRADAQTGGCELSIGAVVASNTGREFDTRLAFIQKPLNSLFPYTSYRLLKKETRNVQWGGPAAFDLPGGRYVVIVPREFKDGRISLKVLVIDGSRPLVDTTLALRNEGTFLVGGPRHDSGVLLIAIGARPAPVVP